MKAWLTLSAVGVVAGVAAAACAAPPTESGAFAFAGSWSYVGSQTTPAPLTFAGPVSLVGSAPAAFEGTAVLTETAPGGAMRVLSGPVSGVVVRDTILDFTAQFLGGSRRHVGVARGDSIAGTWADSPPSVATGSFVLRRAGVP